MIRVSSLSQAARWLRARLDSPWPGRVNRHDRRVFKPDGENRIEIFCKDITRIRNITYIINALHTLRIIYIIYAPDKFPLDMVTRHCAGRRGGGCRIAQICVRSRGLGIFCKDILNTLYKNKCICSLYIKYIIAV